jgi:branched-chain amino acid transport system substrate-binding protein
LQRKKLLTLFVSICLILILASLSVMTACTRPAAGEKTLQIGFLASLTGFMSINDLPASQAAQIAVDMYNERGGLTINGQKYQIELVVEDCKSSGDGSVAAANRLVHDKGIKFIAGGVAFESAAASTVTEPAKVLRSATYNVGMPGELGPDLPYAFCGGACDIGAGFVAIEYLHQAYPEVKTIVEMEPVMGYSPNTGQKVEKFLQERGISRLGEVVVYPDETMDFSTYVAQIGQADPDAFFQMSALGNMIGAFLKGLREIGWNKPYACASTTAAKDLIAIAGKDAATNFFNISDIPGAPDTPPLLAEFQEREVEEIGNACWAYVFAANSVWTMLNAIEAAQSLDPTVVRDTWDKMDTIETLCGPGWMGGQETYGINHQVQTKMPIEVIDNGVESFATWIEVRVP